MISTISASILFLTLNTANAADSNEKQQIDEKIAESSLAAPNTNNFWNGICIKYITQCKLF